MLRGALWLIVVFWPVVGKAESPITVVIKEAPPFVLKAPDGSWTGPAVDLWQHAATVLKRPFEFREQSLPEMLNAVESGEAQVAVGALSVTTARERRFDFTHPFHSTGFGIATRVVEDAGFLSILSKLFSKPFLMAAGALFVVLLLTGFAVFLFERRRNPEQFGGSLLQGLGSGFWWSAVTMTTVGYGDKAPVTAGGRFVALVWMFIAIITISGFTASIASSLTVERLTAVNGPEDFKQARVGTVGGSSSEEYLRDERLKPFVFGDLPEALSRLAAGELDAVVYDLPLLAYQISQHPEWTGVSVLPGSLTSQQYAFAVPSNSDLRESLNRIIPEYISTESWREKVKGF